MMILARRTALAMAMALLAACGGGGAPAVTAEDMSMGREDAPVTMIEYASTTCPHCARFNEDVFPEFKAKYVDTGQVRYVFREFLTPPNEVAAAGFLLARCAGEERYFNVIDALFRNLNQMFQSGDIRGGLMRIGRSTGMTDEQITACIQDEEALAALNRRMERHTNVDKVNATPTFIIDGTRLEGEQTMAQLDAVIQPLLEN